MWIWIRRPGNRRRSFMYQFIQIFITSTVQNDSYWLQPLVSEISHWKIVPMFWRQFITTRMVCSYEVLPPNPYCLSRSNRSNLWSKIRRIKGVPVPVSLWNGVEANTRIKCLSSRWWSEQQVSRESRSLRKAKWSAERRKNSTIYGLFCRINLIINFLNFVWHPIF